MFFEILNRLRRIIFGFCQHNINTLTQQATKIRHQHLDDVRACSEVSFRLQYLLEKDFQRVIPPPPHPPPPSTLINPKKHWWGDLLCVCGGAQHCLQPNPTCAVSSWNSVALISVEINIHFVSFWLIEWWVDTRVCLKKTIERLLVCVLFRQILFWNRWHSESSRNRSCWNFDCLGQSRDNSIFAEERSHSRFVEVLDSQRTRFAIGGQLHQVQCAVRSYPHTQAHTHAARLPHTMAHYSKLAVVRKNQ
jgi:hypothetical protein